MICPLYVSCLFLITFSSVSCTQETSVFGWVLSGLGKIVDILFTHEPDMDEDDVHIYLASKGMNGSEENTANYNNNKGKIFLIVHGYMSRRNYSWYEELTKGILDNNPDSLVGQVSWEYLAAKLYSLSKRYTELVGSRLAKMITSLELDYDVAADRFVLIGHSLGAQISGWAGRYYKNMTGKKLQRIVALDPAQPLYKQAAESERLNANDAEVVVVVHTDSHFGFRMPCGTLDFYVNGGQLQKRCSHRTAWHERLTCDHSSAYHYFIDALSHPDSYLGKACSTLENCEKGIVSEDAESVSMGDLGINKTGLYYVETPDDD